MVVLAQQQAASFQEPQPLLVATGLTFMPMTALTAVVTRAATRGAARFSPRVPIATGQALIAAALLSLCIAAGTGASIGALTALSVLVGFGSSLAVPTIIALPLGSVPAVRAGSASGVLNTFRQVGGALAVAVFGAMIAHRAIFLRSLQVSLVIATLLLLATAAASRTLRPPRASDV